jgi:hypothetical protein
LNLKDCWLMRWVPAYRNSHISRRWTNQKCKTAFSTLQAYLTSQATEVVEASGSGLSCIPKWPTRVCADRRSYFQGSYTSVFYEAVSMR